MMSLIVASPGSEVLHIVFIRNIFYCIVYEKFLKTKPHQTKSKDQQLVESHGVVSINKTRYNHIMF